MSIDSDIHDLIHDEVNDRLRPLKRAVFELAKQISLLAKDPDTIECPWESGGSPDVVIARTITEAIKLLVDACALNQDMPF